MLKTVQYIAVFIWIFGGLFLALRGFKVIKPKITNPEDQEKWELRHKKNGQLMKVLGIVFLVMGIFKLAVLLFDL